MPHTVAIAISFCRPMICLLRLDRQTEKHFVQIEELPIAILKIQQEYEDEQRTWLQLPKIPHERNDYLRKVLEMLHALNRYFILATYNPQNRNTLIALVVECIFIRISNGQTGLPKSISPTETHCSFSVQFDHCAQSEIFDIPWDQMVSLGEHDLFAILAMNAVDLPIRWLRPATFGKLLATESEAYTLQDPSLSDQIH